MIKSKQLAQAFFELSKNETEDLDLKFVDFVKKTKLENQIPLFVYHLEKINKKEIQKNILQIEVAHQINDKTLKKIKESVELHDVTEMIFLREDLIAGFRAKWNGVVYDMSILNSLKKLEEKIIS